MIRSGDDGLGGSPCSSGRAARGGARLAAVTLSRQSLQVELDGRRHGPFGRGSGRSRRDAAGQVWGVRGPIARPLLEDDTVSGNLHSDVLRAVTIIRLHALPVLPVQILFHAEVARRVFMGMSPVGNAMAGTR